MDNGGAASFGGIAPGEGGDEAGGGFGLPAENVREGASETAREAVREAAIERIREGAQQIQAVRAVEGEKGKKEGAVAKGLSTAVQNPIIAGDLLMTVVNRATKMARNIRNDALQELDRVDPLPLHALEFLGLPISTDLPAANKNNYAEDTDNEGLNENGTSAAA